MTRFQAGSGMTRIGVLVGWEVPARGLDGQPGNDDGGC